MRARHVSDVSDVEYIVTGVKNAQQANEIDRFLGEIVPTWLRYLFRRSEITKFTQTRFSVCFAPPSFPYFFFSFFLSSSLLFVFQLLFFTVTLLFVPVLNGSVPKVVNPTNSTHFRFATIGAVDAEWRRRLNPNPIQNEDTANIKLMIIRRWQSEGEDCYPQRYDAIERSPSSIQPSLFLPLCFNRIKLYAIGREVRDEEVEERELGKGEGGGGGERKLLSPPVLFVKISRMFRWLFVNQSGSQRRRQPMRSINIELLDFMTGKRL